VFTGRQSLPLKLADAIGGEREAVEWLQSAKGVAKDLPVRDWTPKPGFAGWRLTSLAAEVASAFGWRGLAQSLLGGGYANFGSIDGLVSIWQ
jgi:protease-4